MSDEEILLLLSLLEGKLRSRRETGDLTSSSLFFVQQKCAIAAPQIARELIVTGQAKYISERGTGMETGGNRLPWPPSVRYRELFPEIETRGLMGDFKQRQ